MSDLNVLVFHRVVESEISEWSDVKLSLFKQLLITAKGNNQVIVSINDWSKNHCGDLAFSFDDGYSSDYEIVFPLLIKFDVVATFFIVPELVNQKGYMTWNQIKEMSDAGMEIGSHSMTHPYITTLPTEQLLRELKDSKMQIEKYIGKEVVSFAYPFGDCSGRTHKAAIEAGYKNICTSKPGLCKSKISTLGRNSVHSNIAVDKSDQLLNPSARTIFKKKTGYSIRYGLKRVLGVNNYIKLRDLIY
jgi:peptidoglycan/xylan/chitin deacetylase (PgdA/CDA1 family)